ncbi:MAG TPA: N-acetylgalactosamine 6-sulfate sulfatase, partial [Opitutae bacterium]|nr:N-acetylgalactosamine 6-sulfate sulfatase [Opitutae bacterium]
MRNRLVIISLLCNCLAQVIFAALEKPNVVIIYGDDVGYGDIGVYGSE